MRTDHDRVRIIARWALGAFLIVAGTGHLTDPRRVLRHDARPTR